MTTEEQLTVDLALFGLWLESAEPPPPMRVSDWALEKRQVSAESGSPHPGEWRHERAPYLVEIMDCMSLSHPSTETVFAKSAQVAGTEAGINLAGCTIDHDPSPIMIVLPTLDEAQKYNRTKLQPTIDATPSLHSLVREQKSRDASGSTAAFKRFPGGYLILTGANSSTGLQMLPVRVLIMEEVSEYPAEVGGRGDPVTQAETRTTAWEHVGYKRVYISTPGIEGECRITNKYQASDQRRLYVPCPQCGNFIILKWEQMRWRNTESPWDVYCICQGCGGVIEETHQPEMVAAGRWIKTCFDDIGDIIPKKEIDSAQRREAPGRQPGFHIWQAYSLFASWESCVTRWKDAEGNPFKEKGFYQQVLGVAWKETGEAPDHEKLFLRRERFVAGIVPDGVLAITGMADVQKNRIEWAIYGWGVKLSGWLLDKGVIEGDPGDDEPWLELEAVTEKIFEGPGDTAWHVDAFGVDAGYLSHRVYLFCRGRKRVFALDGRAGHTHPAIGTPRPVSIDWKGKKIKKGCQLWPTGTWMLKSWVYDMLRKTVEGPGNDGHWKPGTLHFPDICDQDFFKQITAEYVENVEKRGRTIREWRQVKGQPNEQLDIVVGSLALAVHLGLDRMTPRQLSALARQRGADPEIVRQDVNAAKAEPAGRGQNQADRVPAPALQKPARRRRKVRGGRARF